MKRKLIAFLCAFLPALAFASCGNGSSDNSASVQTAVESSAEGADFVIEGTETNQFRVVDNLLISDNLPIIVDFNATWCPPCKKFAPIFDAVAERYAGRALFVSIDVDQYPEIAKAYGVSSIPTVAFIMTGGGELGRQVGFMEEQQFVDYVNQLVDTSAGESGVI